MIVKRHLSKSGSYYVERQFGRGVGGVLLVVGAWLFWRDTEPLVARILLIVGCSLMLLGFFYPRALIWPNRAWTRFSEALSYVSTRVILAVVFFLMITPIGLAKRLTGWDPLGRRREPAKSYWSPYSVRQHDPKHLEKMF
jgi:hypothetical protein